ncbi:MAG: hypothetical protein WCL23_04095 [Candidatus Moraniibacteriota bacterium]
MDVSEKKHRGSIERVKVEKGIPKTERPHPEQDSPEVFLHDLEREIGTLRKETVTELDRMKTDSGLSPKEISEAAQEIGLSESLRDIDREAGALESDDFIDGLIHEAASLREELKKTETQMTEMASKNIDEDSKNNELSYLKLKKDCIDLEMFRNKTKWLYTDAPEAVPRERKRRADLPEAARSVLKETDRIAKRIEERGYDYRSFARLDSSEDATERDLLKEVTETFEKLSDEQSYGMNMLMDLDNEEILDLAEDSRHTVSRAILIDSCIGFGREDSVPIRRLIEAVHDGGMEVPVFESRIVDRIISDKKDLLKSFPIDDMFDELLSDERLVKDGPYGLGPAMESISQEIERLLESGSLSRLSDITGKLRSLDERTMEASGKHIPHEQVMRLFPEISLYEVSIADTLDILEGKMSQDFYDRHIGNNFNRKTSLSKLVPERFVKIWETEEFLRDQYAEGNHTTSRQLEAFLSGHGLSFSDLDNRRKKWVFRSLATHEVEKAPFTIDDIRMILIDNVVDTVALTRIPSRFRSGLKKEICDIAEARGYVSLLQPDLDVVAPLLDEEGMRKALLSGASLDLSKIPVESRADMKEAFVTNIALRWGTFDRGMHEEFFASFDKADFEVLLESGVFIDPSDVSETMRNDLRPFFERLGVSRLQKGYLDTSLIGNLEYQEGILDRLSVDSAEGEDLNSISTMRNTKMRNIRDSFRILDSRKTLPEAIGEFATRFEERYGKKGKHLIALAITAYGAGDPERFLERMLPIEHALDRYYEEDIPDGAHVSTGIEYEVTQSIGNEYAESSALGYVSDIGLASMSGNIGKGVGGPGAIYEIATKPTYNPYMLLAERKLLQDAGFLDFNFERYPKASRGYHLNIGGESGLELNRDALFLSNVLTLAQLNGVMAGKDVSSVKGIYEKRLDKVFEGNYQGGVRVEMKGGGCDTVEQFERAILTSHRAGVVMQLCDRYIPDFPVDALSEVPDDPEAFERMLDMTGNLATPFSDTRERDMVHAWMLLKRDVVSAVEQHNSSFFESEFDGSFVNPKGEYVETTDQIDVLRNQKLVSEDERVSESFGKGLHIDPDGLFHQPTPGFENALIRTNNIFLKGPKTGSNNSVNAESVLQTMKRAGSRDILDGRPQDSIFDRTDGKLRDGYYSIQGASEEMITHKSQILLNRFNSEMERLLRMPVSEKIALEI